MRRAFARIDPGLGQLRVAALALAALTELDAALLGVLESCRTLTPATAPASARRSPS